MSVLFGAHLYGKAAIYFDPNGALGPAAPTGPNLVRYLLGGRSSLLTVNGSNLKSSQVIPYVFSYQSAARFFEGNSLTEGDCPVLTRIGRRQHIFKMNLIYPR